MSEIRVSLDNPIFLSLKDGELFAVGRVKVVPKPGLYSIEIQFESDKEVISLDIPEEAMSALLENLKVALRVVRKNGVKRSCLSCIYYTTSLGSPYCRLKESSLKHPDRHVCRQYKGVLDVFLVEETVR